MEQTQIDDALCRRLIAAALEARKRSYAPYSHYHVGAALWTQSGKLYTGCNIENAAYTPTNCAERTAFFTAVAAGERQFLAIAIAGSPAEIDENGGRKIGKLTQAAWPCGVCRQVMAEFCDPDSFFLCGCRFFPRGIMVCYRIGKAISITTMNYSVAIFVYSRMIRYPDNAITELRYSRISK